MEEVIFISGACSVGTDTRLIKLCGLRSNTTFGSEFVLSLLFSSFSRYAMVNLI